ncbi:MAG: FKBP-type peptidyl-prolyl cis-trans isomerase [Chitinophagaceae bacterium]|nr:FKBP-type peptidyl-prolyl cis-trans isomerase [Chitinophagaceae bacterium]
MKKTTSIFITTLFISALSVPAAHAQTKKDSKKDKSTKTETAKVPVSDSKGSITPDGYTTLEAGTDYKIITDVPGDVYPDYGDFLEIHLNTMVGDSIIFDTRDAMGNGQPAPLQLQKSPFKGDLLEALKHITAGDSAQVRLSVDSLIAAGVPEAPWMKKGEGQKLLYNLRIVSVTPQAVKKKMDEEKAAKQGETDEQLIKDYLSRNKIKAQKTESGLYYAIKTPGSGENARAGQKVSVNYTGMLLNGEKFDSNVDPQFQHVEPFEFMLGAGNVIKGWDEGIALLKKGGKATLYIPSTMAYGPNSPSPKIPANSVLVFEVELNDIMNTGNGQ